MLPPSLELLYLPAVHGFDIACPTDLKLAISALGGVNENDRSSFFIRQICTY